MVNPSKVASEAASDVSSLRHLEIIASKEAKPTETLPGEPPDGGLVAWAQVVSSACCFFNTWGFFNSFGAFQEYYSSALLSGETPSRISWIGSLGGVLIAFGATLCGPFIDAGYIKYLLLTAWILQTFAIMMLSLCKEYWQVMICHGLLCGLGGSIFYICAVSMVAPYFSTKRALAIGVGASGSSLGGIIYPICVHRLVHRIGFGWTCRVAGLLAFVTGGTAFVLCKWRLRPRPFNWNVIDFGSAKDVPFMFYCVAYFMGGLGVVSTNFYLQVYAVDNFGDQSELPFYMTSIFNAASTFGRIFPNMLADRIGCINVLVMVALGSMISVFSWIAVHNLAGMTLMAAFFGFLSAPWVSLIPAVTAEMTPNLSKIGVRLGFLSLFGASSILIAGPIAGVIQDKHGYFWVKIFSGCALVGFLIASLILRQKLVGRKLMVRV